MCLQAGVFVKGVGSQREPPHKNVGTEKRPGGGGVKRELKKDSLGYLPKICPLGHGAGRQRVTAVLCRGAVKFKNLGQVLTLVVFLLMNFMKLCSESVVYTACLHMGKLCAEAPYTQCFLCGGV